jgi:hypothetical protein
MDWIDEIRARGLTDALRVALDALEPLGPVGAQLLWVVQPVSGLVGGREIMGKLAEALEEPGGVERLRQLLDEGTG